MSKFRSFKDAINQQFQSMVGGELFVTDIGKDESWEIYLGSFREGANPIHKERTEHDCQCCKQFIRACAGVVSIVDGKLVSIWDVDIGGDYQIVANAMSEVVKSKPIKDVFLSPEKKLGTDYNHQQLENGDILKWEHFYYELPAKFVDSEPGSRLSELRSCKEVFERGLNELSLSSVETVLELIEQGALYRGEEHKESVKSFLKQKKAYVEVAAIDRQIFLWSRSVEIGGASKFRNTAIGSLVVDISNNIPLDDAVKMFESKVAPTNYKRSSAVVTKKMIESAQKEVVELGIEKSLSRRYAVTDDIKINNVLFADRSAKESMGVFDEMVKESLDNTKNLDKVDEVSIEFFIESILPKADTLELMFENSHKNNLMSLISPAHNDAKNIFKWGNNFTWSYNGEVADSMKERVKKAGGNVEGVLRCSLSWFNYDDLDIHIIEPDGNEIYYRNPRSSTSGFLDVDMNAGGGDSRSAVENIAWTSKNKMMEGEYSLFIHNFQKREAIDVGFDCEIEYDGKITKFHYAEAVKNHGRVLVAKFVFSKSNGIEIIESIPNSQSSKQHWNINTQKFHKVRMIMNSPNHWDGEKTGNKHYFFILEDCKQEGKARGFYNEFLNEDLNKHRKVFEVLGSKMKTEESENQLSGLGFSTTQRNSVFCKVKGAFTRTIKINF